MASRKRVAVIGAGASGLVAARHLNTRAETIECHVFEREENVGGTWRLSEHVGTDHRGLPVHSSMYKNLRTNLPKEIMMFPDFPVPDIQDSYIKFEYVLKYLEEYANHFQLRPLIKFHHLITNIRPMIKNEWELVITDLKTMNVTKHTFDYVMICNGRYSKPTVPKVPGASEFTGQQLHSHDYRAPEIFQGQCVLVIGAGPSARDLTLDIANHARQVILSHHSTNLKSQFPKNVLEVPDVKHITLRGAIFKNGFKSELDSIIYCTGYALSYPFLDISCGVHITERGVEPLYRHFIHLERPSMCFMTLLNNVVPFPIADLQARYFLRVVDGSLQLPSTKAMRIIAEQELGQRRLEGLVGERLAHSLGPQKQQSYCDELAQEADIASIPRVVTKLHAQNQQLMCANLTGYRNARYRIVDDETYERIE